MDHRINALVIQKHNPQRVNVYLDGEFAFGLARIVAAWLEVGSEISDEKIESLRAEDERETAYLLAIKYINYRPRTKAEVQKHLQKHRVREEIISPTLSRLEGNQLVNDAQFAKDWVENRTEFHPRSRKAVAFELRKHGVDPELIETTIDKIDENDMAYQAAIKRARKINHQDWKEFRQKILQHLVQRGFQYDVSSEAARRVWAEISAERLSQNEGAQDKNG